MRAYHRSRRYGLAGAITVGVIGAGVLVPIPAQASGHSAVRAASVKKAPCTLKRIRACVSLGQQRAWLMRNGKVVYGPARITSGRPGYRTDRGMWRVTFKDIDHRSHAFGGAPMPYSVFFHGGEAFHEGSLSVSSHGCVHLSHQSAVKFYNYLHKGDYVRVR